MVYIEQVRHATEADAATIDRLLTQLRGPGLSFTRNALEQMIDSPHVELWIARNGPTRERAIGMCSLVVVHIPTGKKAWIEDVVVDERHRRNGTGRALVNKALERSKALGCRKIELTSRPGREAANRLYRSMGFEHRETNVYRYTL